MSHRNDISPLSAKATPATVSLCWYEWFKSNCLVTTSKDEMDGPCSMHGKIRHRYHRRHCHRRPKGMNPLAHSIPIIIAMTPKLWQRRERIKVNLPMCWIVTDMQRGVHLKLQILQPYLLEWKRTMKCYIKLFQRLLAAKYYIQC